MRTLGILLTCALLSGCATTGGKVVDTFCLSAKKRTWDPDTDSVQTMREAVVYNGVIDRRCSIKRGA